MMEEKPLYARRESQESESALYHRAQFILGVDKRRFVGELETVYPVQPEFHLLCKAAFFVRFAAIFSS